MRSVAGKTALITGGARGMGFGMAQAFVGAGMKVAVADVSQDALDHAKRQLPEIMAVKFDVADANAWESAAQAVEKRLGPVHVLCNNAGVSPAQAALDRAPLEEIRLSEWDWTLAVNLSGPFYGMRTFLPRFKAMKEETHILTTSSMAGLFPFPENVPGVYTASKFGVVGLCEHLKLELYVRGVHTVGVSILFPGLTNTGIFKNSLKLSPAGREALGSTQAVDAALSKMPDTTAVGLDPGLMGKRVLEGILKNEFYIFSHGEYKPIAEAHAAGILESFGPSADPTVKDQIPYPAGYQWGKN